MAQSTHTGFDLGQFGSCAHPLILTNGTLQELFDFIGVNGNGSTLVVLYATDPTQNAFGTIKANGKTFTSASAIYTFNVNIAAWRWTTPFGFSPGTTYPIVFS